MMGGDAGGQIRTLFSTVTFMCPLAKQNSPSAGMRENYLLNPSVHKAFVKIQE